MVYILAAILIFGVLIGVHELGHFLAAKACGVRVNEFAIGMGPAIWKKQKGDTLYALRAFPIGGFCAMEGEDGDSPDPRAFSAQPAWQRAIILAAGAAMNFFLGFLLILCIAPQFRFVEPVISGFMEGCPYEGDLLVGDTFYRINGQRIFARGGWLQPDCLLDNSRKNIFTQARLLAHAGVNIVGSEDMPSPQEDWLESWDRYGLMDWHVFYQCYRMFPGRANAHNPADHDLALACAKDMLLRYRNHPSIIAWFGVNEVMFDEDLYIGTKNAAAALDPSRPFIPTTSVSWDVETLTPWIADDLPTGTTDDGAPDYNWAPSDYYFRKVKEVYLQMFRNELGMPNVPVYRSLERFIPSLEASERKKEALFPLDEVWGEHGAWDANNFCFRAYDSAIRSLWGNPSSASDYARKAQYLSADGYRAMFEAAGHRMWNITTGVMLWKLNACWPDVCWQLYDWYLTPGAAYYFAKKALKPLHVQMNADTRTVSVVNVLPKERKGLKLNVRVFGNDLREHWSLQKELDMAPESFLEVCELPFLPGISAIELIKLELKDASGTTLSENLYWNYTQHQSYYWLATLPKSELHPRLLKEEDGNEWKLTVSLENSGESLAFMQEIILQSDGKPADPVFWDDNFVTLFPGEKRCVTGRIPKDRKSVV